MSGFRPVFLAALAATLLLAAWPGTTLADAANEATARDRGLVLLVGATGRSGPAMLDALNGQGYSRIRALVRDPSSAASKLGPSVELVQGDVKDASSLAKAMQGVSFVVSALGTGNVRDPANSPEKVDYEGVRNLATTAKAAGVKHYVQVSSMGVTNPNHFLNRFGSVMDWKLKGENALRASGVPYTIVRPGGLRDGPAGKAGIRVAQGDRIETGQIPRADVALVCIKALSDPAALGKTFEIISGEPGAAVDWNRFFTDLNADR